MDVTGQTIVPNTTMAPPNRPQTETSSINEESAKKGREIKSKFRKLLETAKTSDEYFYSRIKNDPINLGLEIEGYGYLAIRLLNKASKIFMNTCKSMNRPRSSMTTLFLDSLRSSSITLLGVRPSSKHIHG